MSSLPRLAQVVLDTTDASRLRLGAPALRPLG